MDYLNQLNQFNLRGLIHAPDESDAAFFLRSKKASLSEQFPESKLAKELFDIAPDWVWLVYSSKGLHFWEGGCTWIEKDHVTLQLNPAFKKKNTYFGYSKEEVIAHELVHVARAAFEEPIFEEILAYQTASSPFRRFFGPFLRTTKETLLFLGALGLYVFASLFSVFQTVALAGFASVVTGGSLRLLRAQWIFRRARKNLAGVVGKANALPTLLRMTDREITRFSKMQGEDILLYAKKMSKIHIRWKQITSAYFPTDLLTA